MTARHFNREVFALLWSNHDIPVMRIADAMGISRAGASWHAKAMGLPSRAKVRRRKINPTLLREMWTAGVAVSEIAAHFGIRNGSAVSHAATALGLPKRERGPAGFRNGGWKPTITLAQFLEQRTAARMAALAKSEQMSRKAA